MASIRAEVDGLTVSGRAQVERKNTVHYFRTGILTLKNNLRKAITPLRPSTTSIVNLIGICSSSRAADRIQNNSHVAHDVHGSTELHHAVIECPKPPPQVTPITPTNNAFGVKESRPSQLLASLPLDLLIEIMKYLDWRTILQVRKACRTLHSATTSKAVWVDLHKRLAPGSRFDSKFERPLWLMTSRDLERVFLQRIGIPLGWTRTGIRRARQRDVLDEELEKFHLVEGGRWLLVATLTGSVSCHDLDHPDIKERQLIPDQVRWNRDNVVFMDVDVDKEEEVLTFTLGMCIRAQSESRDHRSFKNNAFVWRVALQLDEEGHGLGLSATRMAFFTLEKYGRVQSISIFGPLICYRVLSTKHPNLYRFAILDWSKQPSERTSGEDDQLQSVTMSLQKVIYADSCPARMRLLPGNQLVVVMSNGNVSLYKLDSLPLQETENIPIDVENSVTQCSWSTRIHTLHCESLSRPFIVTTRKSTSISESTKSVRLVLFSNRGIHGLLFPLDKEDSSTNILDCNALPRVFTLADYTPGPLDCNYAPGYNRAVIRDFRPQIDLMHYSWPDDDSVDAEDTNAIAESTLHKKIVCESWHKFGPLIDESTGRIVISSNMGKRLVVLDTSLYNPNPIT